ncbi:uncharacterized protein BYT42DRAFT_502206 [Radiomyces spectabilis]|uniref:uncharacterized protein n=1 Tax=Radiomyces spectabilis TaxID=64574 RepID=UPI002220B82B|nr:uncharacterized protein BYT42DRAFT_502206 [Radiomyces spectabilis]KAI8370401.1 hypothetical protein BYT42DRAFT_502206 [Radiomyces spectabilis]
MTPSTNLIFDKKKKLILLLARALLKYGCPCHRMDDSLQLSAKMLSLNATFTFLSDSILISISSKDTDEPYTMMVKAANGFDNGKIVRVNRIMNQFHKDKCTLDTCLETLQEITRDPPTVSAWQMIVAFGALGFSASIIMFQGSWIDGALSAVLGSIVGALAVLAGNITIYGRVFEVSACIIVGFTARAMNDYACFTSVAIPSILVLLPGYGMTMAMMELSSHHIPTGTIRLVYAIIYTLMLGYGLQMGSSLYGSINSSGADDGLCNRSVNPWFYIPLFPMMSISIGVSFGSSPKEWPSQIFCAASGFCVTYFLGKVVPDSQIVGSIAAFATALYANLALKVTGEPPLSPLCVGVTFLVPGSIGVRGVYALLHQEDLAQAIFALRMIMIAMGLSVGIFAASMIIYPSGKTKSLYISF